MLVMHIETKRNFQLKGDYQLEIKFSIYKSNCSTNHKLSIESKCFHLKAKHVNQL